MITTIIVELITAVIGPAVLEWVKLKFNKPRVYIDTGEGSNIFHEMEQEIYKILID
jgi:hypothetical protein